MTYPSDIDEWRRDVRRMTEVERVEACGHTSRTGAMCPDCDHDIRDEL